MTTPEGPYRYEQIPDDPPHRVIYYKLDCHMFCVVDQEDAERAISQLNAKHATIQRLREQNDAQHAQIERLREALQEICDRCKHAACDPLADIAREFNDAAIFAWSALKQEASE
jgi:hypothetical protein